MFQARNFEIFPINSMEKIRGNFRPQMFEDENTALIDERFGFQVAFRSIGRTLTDLTYSLKGCDKDSVNVFFVQSVPCTYSVAENSDDYVLETSACMMPDILAPITESGIVARSGVWQSFYIVLSGLSAGKYTLKFSVSAAKGEVLGEIEYVLTVLEKSCLNSILCVLSGCIMTVLRIITDCRYFRKNIIGFCNRFYVARSNTDLPCY